MKHFCPPPRWTAIRWLTSPRGGVGAEVTAELREGMFRRLDSLLISAVNTILITVLCYIQHPTPFFRVWTIIDVCLNLARMGFVLAVMRALKRQPKGKTHNDWILDWFVTIGMVWCLQVGFGTGLCLATGDPTLGIFASLLAMGTVGAQCARNTAAPRVTRFQFSLIIIPFSIGAGLSPLVFVNWVLVLAPLYALGMMAISRELHADYVAMIVARIENRRAAMHCSLTCLPNRMFFEQTVVAALRDTSGQAVTIAYLDLDGFKAINDNLGHPMGDALLKLVAERIMRLAPGARMRARLGGDEFAILMASDDRTEAESMARSIIDGINEPFSLGDRHSVVVGISIGIATCRAPDICSFEQLLENADEALYAAKRAGRGTYRWYVETPGVLSGDQRRATPGVAQAA